MPKDMPETKRDISRRGFLRTAALASGGLALASCDKGTREAFLQRHFRDMTREELAEVLDRLQRQHSERFGKAVSVTAEPPMEDVNFGYALDLSRCIGCRRCVYGCVEENNCSRDPQLHLIHVLEMSKEEGVNLHEANAYYDPEVVPREGHFYMPVACQQCRNPQCTTVCPVGATWQEQDGIVVVDYDWCIGCRCCMAACPYGARHFNWATPTVSAEEYTPETHFLGNRVRPVGVVEKCTFCVKRVRNGRYPACVEVCPVGARKFGNLLDPQSEIRYILENKRVLVFKEELNTQPRFYYFYGT
jgi:molybdopterin-containing oxidoreductase family iron-sulfur binding subunit